MITASTSSRLIAEAIPAPSASIARSISRTAIGSWRTSARAQMPEVRRSRPRFSMMLKSSVCSPFLTSSRARVSIAPRPA